MTHTGGGCQFIYDDNNQKIPNPYENKDYIGNVLIIQEKRNNNEWNACPDDTGRGGWIEFEFCKPARITSSSLLDVDGSESAKIVFEYWDGSNTENDPFPVPSTGDNGYFKHMWEDTPEVATEDVRKIRFEYTGSGSAEGIDYWYCPN